MKKTSLLSILFLMPFLIFSQIKTVAFSDLDSLQKENPKPVIIHLYTDWCSVCKIESFQLKKDKELVNMISEKFYFISFEAEKTKEKISFRGKVFNYLPNGTSGIHELALALSKNKDQPIYPLWIILDKDQNLIEYHEGLFKPEEMKKKLMTIVKL